MGTISQKLTYLNDTKQLLKENINNLGGNLTTEPFRQYASVLEGIYESLPKVSGIGSSLSLSPTMVGKIKLNEIQGDTLQENTPTPDTPVEIQNVTGLQNINITGKNLFDMSTAVQSPYGYHNNTGTLTHIDNNTIKIVKGNTSTDARMSVANNINISSGTTISVSWEYGTGNGNVVGQIQAVNNSGIAVNLTSLNNSGLSSPQILTLTDDIKYIYLGTAWNNHSDLVVKNIQIEENSQATSYEPYKGNTYEVNLGDIELNKIGTYQDRIYKENDTWYIEKQIGKVVLDGSESWSFTSGTRERFTTSMSDIALQPFDSSASIVAISNYFVGTTWYNLYNNTSLNNALSSHNSTHQINIRATQFNGSVDEFKTWLSTNKPEVIYALETPTYTEITNTELINQLESIKSQDGTTNISITSENLPMIINASALKGED